MLNKKTKEESMNTDQLQANLDIHKGSFEIQKIHDEKINTLVYCVKQLKGQDFVVKRVLTKDLEIVSPYNTYKNTGLPPTLIAMPDVSAIDAVLNYKKHSYYYMCASVTKIGFHEFAHSLAQHNRNAQKYQRWINNRGINR